MNTQTFGDSIYSPVKAFIDFFDFANNKISSPRFDDLPNALTENFLSYFEHPDGWISYFDCLANHQNLSLSDNEMEYYIKCSKCLKYYYIAKQNPKMSVFYALAIFHGIKKNNRAMLKDFGEKMLKKYMKETNQEKEVFKGINIFDLPKFEKILDVPIMVYEILDPLIGTKECIFRTSRHFEKPKMYLVEVDRYKYAYILDVDAFRAHFICEKCKKVFLTHKKHVRHSKTHANRKPKLVYPENRVWSMKKDDLACEGRQRKSI